MSHSGSTRLECQVLGVGPTRFGMLGIEGGELVFAGQPPLAIPLTAIRDVSVSLGIVTLTYDANGTIERLHFNCFDTDAMARRAAKLVTDSAKQGAVPSIDAPTVDLDDEVLFEIGTTRSRGRLRLTGDGLEFDGSFGFSATLSAIASVKLVSKNLFVMLRKPVRVTGTGSHPGFLFTPQARATRWLSELRAAAERASVHAMNAKAAVRKPAR